MKKFILFACILASFLPYNAQAATKPVVINNNNQSCEYSNNTKCSELILSMHNKRATLYNVLNLSNDQQKCKEVIDQKRFNEIEKQNQEYFKEKYVLDNMSKHNASTKAIKKQEKLVKNIEKTIKEINNKYDKEFKSILNSEQRGKYNTIRKIEKKGNK